MPRLPDGSVELPLNFEDEDSNDEVFTGVKLQDQFDDLKQVSEENLDTFGRNIMQSSLDMGGNVISNEPTINRLDSVIDTPSNVSDVLVADGSNLSVSPDGSAVVRAGGVNQVAMGVGANSGSDGTVAIGSNATGDVDTSNAVIIGSNASASTPLTVGVGANSVVGINSVSVGASSSTGESSVSVGSGAINGNSAVSIGRSAISAGSGVAIGNEAVSNIGFNVAIGNESVASSQSISIGVSTYSNINSVAIGRVATANAENSIAIGRDVATNNEGEVRFGNGSIYNTGYIGNNQIGFVHLDYLQTRTVGTSNVTFTGLRAGGIYSIIANDLDNGQSLFINGVRVLGLTTALNVNFLGSTIFIAKSSTVNVNVDGSFAVNVTIRGGF